MTLDWKNLGFSYLPTHGFIRVNYRDGEWGSIEVSHDPYVPMHIASNCLHYGQACFEGLKAFRQRDGKVVLFRVDAHAKRMVGSAMRLCMEAPPEELFIEACKRAVELNQEFVPPFGTGASLYIRPLLIGTEPTIGIKPADEYALIVMVTPVGPYYKNGFCPVEALVIEDYERVAMKGTGQAKAAGNYASSLKPYYDAKKKGYTLVLFLDPKENRYVEEFGTSNFVGITADGQYKTPDSSSILKGITNESLKVLASQIGLTVSTEPIPVEDLTQFQEVGAVGTAAVITPVHKIHHGEKKHLFGHPQEAGPTLTQLYQLFRDIQLGEHPDHHGWLQSL